METVRSSETLEKSSLDDVKTQNTTRRIRHENPRTLCSIDTVYNLPSMFALILQLNQSLILLFGITITPIELLQPLHSQ
jgi:hypothetical protein